MFSSLIGPDVIINMQENPTKPPEVNTESRKHQHSTFTSQRSLTVQPTTAAGLVQKYTLLPAVGSDRPRSHHNEPLHGSFESVSGSTLLENLGTFASVLSNESNFNVIYDFGFSPSSKQEN